MNAKELAAKLSGVEYGNEYSLLMRDISKQAKESGLVIAVGESDDLLEFYGAFRDEVGAWDGVTAFIDERGALPSWENIIDDGDEAIAAKYFERKKNARSIEAVWCGPENAGYAWVLKTDIPHETFAVMEDGDGFSRGIVFSIADLKGF